MHVNCLLIDDEVELTKMTKEYFEMFGVTCEIAADSESCLSFLKENTADIFLLDINLGNESGFALCKKLRETYDTPILFISANSSTHSGKRQSITGTSPQRMVWPMGSSPSAKSFSATVGPMTQTLA